MKKKFNFKKFAYRLICCVVLASLLCCSFITASASMPSDPVYSYSRFNIENMNKTSGNYFRYYLEVYNWNQSDNSNNVAFSSAFNQYFFPYNTADRGEIPLDSMESLLNNELKHVYNVYNFVNYNSISSFISDYSILVYFDPVTLETVYLYFVDSLSSGNPLGSYASSYYSINGISNGSGYTSDNKVKKVYNFVASNTTNNLICFEYRISSRSATYSTYNYSLKRLTNFSFWIAPQNIIYASSSILNVFGGYDDTTFSNFYFNSYANYVSFAYCPAPIQFLTQIVDGLDTKYVLLPNKIPNSIDGYYIDFKYYFIGKFSPSFNWSRYCAISDPFLLNGIFVNDASYELLGYNAVNINGHSYHVYSIRKYFYFSPSANTYSDYMIKFYNSYLTNYNDVPDIDPSSYFFFMYGSGIGSEDKPGLDYYWNQLVSSSAFVQSVMQRLYFIMPSEVYGLLILSLTFVVALATIRLGLH